MPRINKMRCSLCGKEHQATSACELMRQGWYVEGIGGKGMLWSSEFAKRLICPECIQRIYGDGIRLSLREEYTKQEETIHGQLPFNDV